MPYFAFALSLPLWYMIQIKKIMEGKWAPEGVKTEKSPE